MLKKTKIALAVALIAATPGTAYAGNSSAQQCRFDIHGGGWILLTCLAGMFK